MTIVVSPLLALMKDQVSRLKTLNIPCAAWTSETTPAERAEVGYLCLLTAVHTNRKAFVDHRRALLWLPKVQTLLQSVSPRLHLKPSLSPRFW